MNQFDFTLVFGNGWLGNRFTARLNNIPGSNAAAVISKVDIRKYHLVEQEIERWNPGVIINTAAKTNIDWCENNKKECEEINFIAAYHLAKFAVERGIYFIHIGSACIFEGIGQDDQRGFIETDTPNPGCFYGHTKQLADEAMKNLPVLIVRPRAPFSGDTHPRNLLMKFTRYTDFIDDQNSLTNVEDFLRAVDFLREKRATGIYHITNPGTASPYQIAEILRMTIQPNKIVNKITKEELDKRTHARRVNTIINCDKLFQEGFVMRTVREALIESIRTLRGNIGS
ncbi:MAG: sugar nucleotide-binding protein [Parcubacteria group bacterium]|nr:sugar nucleotide-binding protein [Parcubacteria group bacterium]